MVTPGGVPGVLDEPVVQAGGRVIAPAYTKHGVIEAGAARSIVKDATLVGLEDVLVSLDGDSKRLHLESSLHLLNVASSDETFGRNHYVCSHASLVFA